MTQSSKTLLQLLVLVVVAGALGLFAYFGVHKKDEAETAKKDHDARLFAPEQPGEKAADAGVAKTDFSKLTVTFDGQTTVLEREPGAEWRVVAPVQAKADKLVLDALTSQLQTSKFKATLEENPDQATLTKYGLDAPKFVVEAIARVGGEQRTVKLEGGIENTFDGTVYMRRNGEKPVFTAEGGVRYALAKTTFDLRDKQLFALDEKKLSKLTMKSKSNDWALERDASKQWVFTKPFSEPGDPTQVSAMIGSMSGERAQAFPADSAENRKAFGLEAPLLDVTATLDDGKTIRFRVGRPAGDAGEKLYALREDESGTVLAEVTNGATQFDRNPGDLKDKTVVRFKKEQVSKIVFHNADGSEVIVAKDSPDASAESWKVVAPRAGKAKVFKVTSVLWTLGAFKASTLGEEKPKDWAKFGIDAKSRFIALFDGDTELARFTIGKEVPGKANTFYVRGTRNQVAESDGSRFNEFPAKAEDVLDEPVVDAGKP